MAKKEPKVAPVRLTAEALKWARIASGYTGESMAAYVSRIVVERGMSDVQALHAELETPKPREPKPKR